MSNAVQGVYYCNQYRTLQLSNRMYERNVPGVPLQMNYETRPVDTKFKVFPILDCRMPSYTKCERRPIYNTRHMFAGSSQALPFNGYQAKVDTESALKNIIFPLQECPQSKFIPGTRSDMYNTTYLTPPIETTKMTNNLLFKQEKFAPFNPNMCNLGKDRFNNFTRIQVKNLGMKGSEGARYAKTVAKHTNN